MTNITREELEACARLLGYDKVVYAGMPDSYVRKMVAEDDSDLVQLARAAGLEINYRVKVAAWGSGRRARHLFWPNEGTEAECIIKAAAAVQLGREKT